MATPSLTSHCGQESRIKFIKLLQSSVNFKIHSANSQEEGSKQLNKGGGDRN
jgi:hypothetical protein